MMAPRMKRRKPKRAGTHEETRVQCRGHLQWIRGYPCSAPTTGLVRHDDGRTPCAGRIEAHHQKTRGAGGGDEQAVPLCASHHRQLDSPGWSQKRFEELYKVDFARIAADLWRDSTAGIKYRMERE